MGVLATIASCSSDNSRTPGSILYIWPVNTLLLCRYCLNALALCPLSSNLFLASTLWISSRLGRGKNTQAGKSDSMKSAPKRMRTCFDSKTNSVICGDFYPPGVLRNDFSWLWGVIIAICTSSATKELEYSYLQLTFLVRLCDLLNASARHIPDGSFTGYR